MNEKGFMYPVTLSILALFLLFLTLHFEQYVTEKKLLEEVEQYEKRHFYFLQSLQKIQGILMEEQYQAEGFFVYKEGTVFYNIEEASDSTLKINFRLEIPSGKTLLAIAYFDKNLGQMIKWIERG